MTTKFIETPVIAPESTLSTAYADLTAAGAFGPGEKLATIDSTEGLKVYRLFKFNNGDGNVATADGAPVGFLNSTLWDGYTVTSDFSYANSIPNAIAGISLSAVTDTYYAWFQTYGEFDAVLTNADDDIAIGDNLHWSADNAVDSIAGGTDVKYRLVGWAISADVDASDTVEAYLTIER